MDRDWQTLERRHRAFWACDAVDRPLIQVIYDAYVDTELVAAQFDGELQPAKIDPRPILAYYDQQAQSRELVGDDAIAVAEPLLGIPWLEAICGCRVFSVDGKSLWPERPEHSASITQIAFSPENPWFKKLLEVIASVVKHADGRYTVGMSHLRGPTDVLAALFGSEQFFMMFYDQPALITSLANEVAQVWRRVADAEARLIPAFNGGYGVRQFGLWAPELAVWLQDDTSSMLSLAHYQQFFLQPMQTMSAYPYGVLHLHVPSLHLAETFADVPNIRAINLYFDSKKICLQDAMPTLRRLQARSMPLILAKDVYEGFSLEEYDEILDGLSPRGLSVHLKADTVDEARAAMAYVNARCH